MSILKKIKHSLSLSLLMLFVFSCGNDNTGMEGVETIIEPAYDPVPSSVKIPSISSTAGTYGAGSYIPLIVEFNEPVDVTGQPQLEVTIGRATQYADYASGSGAKALIFKYQVASGEIDADGITAESFFLGSATIKDKAGNEANANNLSITRSDQSALASVYVDGKAPVIQSVSSVSSTYGSSDPIEIKVAFDEPVDVTGKPQLEVTVGGTTQYADYASGTGTDQLVFKYKVKAGDVDPDGIEAKALDLNSGTIKDKAGNAYNPADFDLEKIQQGDLAAVTVDGQAPVITSIDATSGAGPYGHDKKIVFTVTFDEEVYVDTDSGQPQLEVTIDGATKDATYDSGSGTDKLTFKYKVKAGDVDPDGIEAKTLDLNSGTIKDKAGNDAFLVLDSADQSSLAKVTVDGKPPAVTSIGATPDAYGHEKEIAFTVAFDKTVDVGTISVRPLLKLTIAGQPKIATYDSGTGTDKLTFKYKVEAGDVDPDGIAAKALDLNSGTIKDKAGNAYNPADFDLEKVQQGDLAAVTVDGQAPVITSIDATPDAYGHDKKIVFTVTFDETVDVNTNSGIPLLKVSIGDVTKDATYDSVAGSKALAFKYTVTEGEVDPDGVEATGLALNSGTIKDKAGNAYNPADFDLGKIQQGDLAAVTVDGQAPVITSIDATSGAGPYGYGQEIVFTVTFDKTVDVDTSLGKPQLEVTIGRATKDATYDSVAGSKALVFKYKVKAGDVDPDGIEATALALNLGTIKDKAGNAYNPADFDLGKIQQGDLAAVTVDGQAPVITSIDATSGAGPYGYGQEIVFTVTFDKTVDVDTSLGKPQLEVTIGRATKDATYDSVAGSKALVFKYKVKAGDVDPDGVEATALALNLGTIKDKAGNAYNPADFDLGKIQQGDLAAVTVDGKLPVITSIDATSGAGPYGYGQEIVFTVTFDKTVDVDTSLGKPQLEVTIGRATKDATYDSVAGSKALVFKYTVEAGDVDPDGVEATALALNLGTIKDKAGNAYNPADFDLGKIQQGDLAAVTVDGKLPVITSIDATSGAGPYGYGQEIVFTVTFDKTVDVDTSLGKPQLEVTIGRATKDATYDSVAGSKALVFKYKVKAGDVDPDGIEATALDLNSGTIKDKAGNAYNPADFDLGKIQQGDLAAVTVDGQAPVITSIDATSGAGPYGYGQEIVFTVTFDKTVDVDTSLGKPQLEVTIGRATKDATYDSVAGSKALVFKYKVKAGDVDPDGIEATALALNLGTIKDKAGNAYNPADFDLGKIQQGDLAAVTVDGKLPVITSIDATSGAGPYGYGQEIVFTVTFDKTVDVDTSLGKPQLEVTIGRATKDATYDSVAGSKALVFKYKVKAGDVDPDGIEATALDLNSGTIKDKAGNAYNPADFDLGKIQQGDLAAVTVDGQAPVITSIDATSGAGPYGYGQEIVFTVTFDKTVDVDTSLGKPQLEVTIGRATKDATYDSVAGSKALVFKYKVKAGDVDPDGIEATALALNLGTIKDKAGNAYNPADFDLGKIQQGDLAAVTVDGQAPVITSIDATSGAGPYGYGQEIVFTVTFDKTVDVDTSLGKPQLEVTIGRATKDATYDSVAGSKALVFKYTVEAGDVDPDGVEATALALNLGTIKDKAGNAYNPADFDLGKIQQGDLAAVTVDGKLPVITSIDATSGAGPYGYGQEIVFTVTFDKTVDVDTSLGKPQLEVTIGRATKDATYDSVAGSKALVFKYKVKAGDVDPDGIEATALALNLGTIKDKAGNAYNPADFDLGKIQQGDLAAVTVDGKLPVITSIDATSGAGPYGYGQEIVFTVTFDKTVDVDTSLGKPQLEVTIGRATKDATYDSVAGSKALVFKYTVEAGDVDPDGVEATALALNLGTIKDKAGNAYNPADFDLGKIQQGDLAAVTVDGKLPVITSIGAVPGNYDLSDTMELTVTFDEVVYVRDGRPQLNIEVGQSNRADQSQIIGVSFFGGNGTNTLTFKYQVSLGDYDADGIKVKSLSLGLSTIKDGAGNAADLTHVEDLSSSIRVNLDGRATSVKLIGISEDNKTYTSGEEIKISVTFSRPVQVDAKGSDINIGLDIGGSRVSARYTGETNDKDDTMEFVHVASGTMSSNGIGVVADSIKKGEASITSKGADVNEEFSDKVFSNVVVNAPFDLYKVADIWFDATDIDADGDSLDQKAGDEVSSLYDKSGNDRHMVAHYGDSPKLNTSVGYANEVNGSQIDNNNNLSLFFYRYKADTLESRSDLKLATSSYTYFTSFSAKDVYNLESRNYIFGTHNSSYPTSDRVAKTTEEAFTLGNSGVSVSINFTSVRPASGGRSNIIMLNSAYLSSDAIHKPRENIGDNEPGAAFVSDSHSPGLNRFYSRSGEPYAALPVKTHLVKGKKISMGGFKGEGSNNRFRFLMGGGVNEVLYFTRELTLAERAIVENYISSKWASPADPSYDFYTGDDTDKGDYDYEVTGILKRPALTITSKQPNPPAYRFSSQESYSYDFPASKVSTARAGALLIANNASDGFLKDEGDSVFAGSKGNGATKDNLPNSGVVSTVRSSKVWYLDVSDAGSAGGKIDLAFTPSLMGFDWTADAASYELLWSANDPSASPPVSFETMASAPTSAANGIVRFNGIETKSGYIALGLKKDTMAPSLRYAEVTGDKEITLTFDESLASPPSGFSVSGGGVNVSNTSIDTRSDNKVVLATGSDIQSASTVSYYNGAVSDITGNALASLPNVVVGTSKRDTIDLTSLTSSSFVVAGAGDDAITASSGSDVFDYNFITDGNDTISGFNKSVDKIDLSDLLQYSNGQDISKFIEVINGNIINIDAHGRGNTSALAGTGERDISITLNGVTGLTLNGLINDGVLILTAP